MYGDPLTPLERDAIAGFLNTADRGLAGYRGQLAECRIKSRKLTGVGFFTTVVVPQRLAAADTRRRVVSGINAEIDGAELDVGFVLYVQDGMIDMLEGFVYGDASWPERIEGYTIRTDKEMNDGLNQSPRP